MGSGVSSLFSCLKPETRPAALPADNSDILFSASEPLDETLGHSFCYVRSSNRFLSPSHSDRFLSPSQSLRFSPPHEPPLGSRTRTGPPETAFKAISGASVSANSSIPRSVLMLDAVYDDATDTTLGASGGGCGVRGSILNGFESTSSFTALPLQPVPRGGTEPLERGGFFLSGPIERGALSGPLDANVDGAGAGGTGAGAGGGSGGGGRVHFSAPLGGMYVKKKRKKSISGFRKAFTRNFSDKRPWVVPVLNFVGRKESSTAGDEPEVRNESDVQWALGKAGEDRVHVVVSEEQGWLFVGIYDGFNGPDAPEFLMGNLYRAVFNELQGLFWEIDDNEEAAAAANSNPSNVAEESTVGSNETNANPSSRAAGRTVETNGNVSVVGNEAEVEQPAADRGSAKRVTFQSEDVPENRRRRRLWEYLAEDDTQDGLDLSGSDRFAFSVDDALSVNSAGSVAGRRWLLLSKLKQGLSKHKEGHVKTLFPWKYGLGDKEKAEAENRVEETSYRSGKRRKEGLIDHELVLGALSRALEITELAYLDMTDKLLDTNPELALMGSCLLVVLMRDEDVYVMNLGDSRAIVAQYEQQEVGPSEDMKEEGLKRTGMEGIIEESTTSEGKITQTNQPSAQTTRLTALQLSTDHSTSIEEEVRRIKNEHPDDKQCIVNDRVKGRLKVTRAFGAGFLKQPKLNDALLEMFRNEYIGTAPYLSCLPSLRHHRLCPTDQFIVLSSDGLYQYLTNEEVVSYVENFMEKFPDGDPAQHLIEELLCRAARKAGMDFHELLDIPQGDRRKYHDDVTVMVISLEGRIWKSSGKYL